MAIALSMVALSEPRLPTADETVKALARQVSLNGPAKNIERGEVALSFDFEGHRVAIALLSVPIPWTDLEGPCATSPFWPNAAEELRRHRAHLLVTVFGDDADAIGLSMTMTRVVAAITALPGAIGVYWGNGGVVQSPQVFRAMAQEMTRELLPLYLWIGFRVGQNPDGTLFGFTTGLQAFGQMELEISRCNWTPRELVERLFNFAHYVLDNGPVLLDGQTIGTSADERIVIEHRATLCGDGRTVVHLQP